MKQRPIVVVIFARGVPSQVVGPFASESTAAAIAAGWHDRSVYAARRAGHESEDRIETAYVMRLNRP